MRHVHASREHLFPEVDPTGPEVVGFSFTPTPPGVVDILTLRSRSLAACPFSLTCCSSLVICCSKSPDELSWSESLQRKVVSLRHKDHVSKQPQKKRSIVEHSLGFEQRDLLLQLLPLLPSLFLHLLESVRQLGLGACRRALPHLRTTN